LETPQVVTPGLRSVDFMKTLGDVAYDLGIITTGIGDVKVENTGSLSNTILDLSILVVTVTSITSNPINHFNRVPRTGN